MPTRRARPGPRQSEPTPVTQQRGTAEEAEAGNADVPSAALGACSNNSGVARAAIRAARSIRAGWRRSRARQPGAASDKLKMALFGVRAFCQRDAGLSLEFCLRSALCRSLSVTPVQQPLQRGRILC